MSVSAIQLPNHTPLLQLAKEDVWTVGDSFEGTQIIGANGSGKTTGSGEACALAMLRLGYGGLVLTVKNDDPGLWTDPVNGYLQRSGRLHELVEVKEGGDEYFDFLQYELTRPGLGAGSTLELAGLFTTVLEAFSGGVGQSDGYWSYALSQLMKNTIELAKFATGQVSLYVLSKIIHSAPQSIDATKDWEWERVVDAARANARTDQDKRDLDMTLDYFNGEFPRLGDKLRSSIVSLFTSMADNLLRGTIGTLFSGRKVTITPEQSHDGKIIVINLPVKQYGDTGRLSQMIFKYVWQKAAERREKSKPMRPVFLWCDECQELITGHDAAFQGTARSSRVATVYLTQNLSSYHARLGGGPKAEAYTNSLLGNLATTFCHRNGDSGTNRWASELFGKEQVVDVSVNKRRDSYGVFKTEGENHNVRWEDVVPQSEFKTLKSGGTRNSFRIGAFVSAGRKWKHTGTTALYVEFTQSVSYNDKLTNGKRSSSILSGLKAFTKNILDA